MFSDTLFNSIVCFVQSPSFALWQFNMIEAFLLYMVSSQCIELSLLATTLIILFSERGMYFLTGMKVIKATNGFEHGVAMKTKPLITKAVDFILSASCKEAFNFTFWPCSLKIGYDYHFKPAVLVLSWHKPTRLWIEILTRIKTGRLGLTYRIWI